MTKVQTTLWHISGYHGFSDYDGPADNNINCIIAMDSRFTKSEVIGIMQQHYAKDRCTSICAEPLSDTPITIGSYEKTDTTQKPVFHTGQTG